MKISLQTSKENFLKELSKFSSGKYINETGLYKVTIKKAVITDTSTGAKKCSLNVTPDGGTVESIINLGVIIKSDGSENPAGNNRLLALLEIFKLKEANTTSTTIQGFDGNDIEAEEIKDFANKSLYIQVQKEYSKYNGKIYRNLMLVDCFRLSDKANTIEILNNKELGERFAWLEANAEKAFKDKYNGVTKEEVDTYYAERAKNASKDKKDDSFDESENEELPF